MSPRRRIQYTFVGLALLASLLIGGGALFGLQFETQKGERSIFFAIVFASIGLLASVGVSALVAKRITAKISHKI